MSVLTIFFCIPIFLDSYIFCVCVCVCMSVCVCAVHKAHTHTHTHTPLSICSPFLCELLFVRLQHNTTVSRCNTPLQRRSIGTNQPQSHLRIEFHPEGRCLCLKLHIFGQGYKFRRLSFFLQSEYRSSQ